MLPRIHLSSMNNDKSFALYLVKADDQGNLGEWEFSVHAYSWSTEIDAYAWISGELFALKDKPVGIYPPGTEIPFYPQDNDIEFGYAYEHMS
jgi:hypothetical protein